MSSVGAQKNGRVPSHREIERKFLIKRLPDKLHRWRHYPIAQGYLAIEPAGRQVRLRKQGNTASLTFKIDRGGAREEREIKLTAKQFAALWPATAGRRLRKLRYGKLSGLVVAEVEFPNRVTCREFEPPPWFGREVTGEKHYSNVRLATE